MAEVVWVAVEDLIFRSKIEEAARHLGAPMRIVAWGEISQAIATGRPSGILLDLNHPAAIETLKALKAQPAAREVRIIGFFPHVNAEQARRARAAGCDVVMARSAFSQQLPRLIRELAQNQKLTEPIARRAPDDL